MPHQTILPSSPPDRAGGTSPRPIVKSPALTFDDLLDAIEWVESKGDANAIGDNGRAVGAYQLHHCYVQDASCERNYDYKNFNDNDRYDKKKSREIIRLYMSRYATYGRLGRYPTFEDMARIHNGGPRGYKKESTKAYWQKVKARLEKKWL